MPVEHFSHVGLCVADLERALRFYRDGLGFRERSRLALEGEPSATLLSLPDVSLEAVYLAREGLRLELLHYPTPGAEDLGTPRPMNGLGLTHLSLRVSDLAGLLPGLVDAGGRVLDATRIDAGPVQVVFVLDPDGTRLELVESPGDPSALPGE